jgi:2-polyprenyl-6-methoxyphenol hydroxylase-like FAD-dependent oxidoreductase
MALKRETDVLVVGAGPVGLFAALSLAERGIAVEVIDKEWHGSAHSYALALHPGTLRMLDEVGAADELLATGHRVERVAFYEGDTRAGALEISELGAPHPFVLVVPQSALERALEKALKQRKVKVFWNHQCLAMSQDGSGVSARVARMEKYSMGYPVAHTEWMVAKEYDVRSRFLIGADGYHSSTRKNLGSRYEHKGEAEAFSVYEFQAEIDSQDEVRVVFHDGRLNVVWPLHGKRARWSFQVERDSPAPPTLDGLREMIRSRAPWFDSEIEELHWTATVVFERRLVDRFGRDHVWLAGDAAHITGPVGAQSMNVGLRESYGLAERFSAVVKGEAQTEAMRSFEDERQSEWSRLLGGADVLRTSANTPAWAAKYAGHIVPCVPASGPDLQLALRQIDLEFE